jgi:hypothetical protein
VTDVNNYYGFTSVTNLVGWNCSHHFSNQATFCVNWYDDEAANSFTYADYWRCTNSTCSGGSTYLGAQWNYAGAAWYQTGNSTNWGPGSGVLRGYYYWASVHHYNASKSFGPATYTSIVHIP